jgi:hypothetical protein
VTKPSKEVDLALMLLEYIQRRDGIVTSPRGAWPLQFQTPIDSSLPVELGNLGHNVRSCGQTTRLQPGGTVEIVTRGRKETKNRHPGFVEMSVFEISLPPAKAD